MSTQAESSAPLKIFLWATPRSTSTTFLKCMTFVPETSAWFEPYFQMKRHSLDYESVVSVKDLVKRCGGHEALQKIDSGFDASDKTMDWLKERLEGDFPGKKLVFVKDLAIGADSNCYNKIPKGFRHTFLMRHPGKLFNLKIFMKLKEGNLMDPNVSPDKIRPYQDLNELWKFVKAEGLEDRPIIIDADDLLRNPKEVLVAYCKEVGIPFSEDLLTWEAGEDVMTNRWVVPKQTILSFRTVGMHDTTFSSTEFTHPDMVATKKGEIPKISQHVLDQAKQFMGELLVKEMPYYEEMYAERLIADVDTK